MISLIIPTYNRPDRLKRLLKSLENQTFKSFEVVVVDNKGDDERVKAVCQEAGEKIRYISHPFGGATGARNRGVVEARFDIVSFVDDDETCVPEYFESYAEFFNSYPQISIAGGPCKVVYEGELPEYIAAFVGNHKIDHVYGNLDAFDKITVGYSEVTVWGGNMAVRKDVFRKFGFHPDLYKGKLFGDGDTGLVHDWIKVGNQVAYVPKAAIFHHIEKDKLNLQHVQRVAAYIGASRMWSRWYQRKVTPLSITKEFFYLTGYYMRTWLADYKYIFKRKTKAGMISTYNAHTGYSMLSYLKMLISSSYIRKKLMVKEFSPFIEENLK